MRVAALVFALSITICSAAQAATKRFATPLGSGLACTSAAPCAITTAVNSAGAGDDVTLTPGTYGSPATPLTTLSVSAPDVTVHAAPGQPAITYVASTGFALESPGDVLTDVVVHGLGVGTGAVLLESSSRADRVMGIADGSSGAGCVITDAASIADSVCLGTAPFADGLIAVAFSPGAALLRATNVTAIARNAGSPPGDNAGNGVQVTGAAGSPTLAFVNSIAIGAEHDARVNGMSGASAEAVFDHSYAANRSSSASFATLVDGAGVFTTAPTFLGTGFAEAAGSTSVDAGTDAGVGPLDIDGVPRTLGAHTDVGAYEQRVAAGATTSAASDATATGATLHANVAPNGSAATYHFEYGTTTTYGATTPDRALAQGTPTLDVSEGLSGLAPGTTYHARIVVTGPGGGAIGGDIAFTTAAPTTVTVPGPTPKPATKPCTVPSVKAGSTVLAAITKLARAGCKLGSTTHARSKKVHKGRVIRLTIKAHTKTTKSIGLVVSRGRR